MASPKPSATWLFKNPDALLAFGFGSGLAPKSPGTFGTLAALPLYWLIQGLPLVPYLLVLTFAFAFGVSICGRASRKLGVHDHSGIVWDEFVGFGVTMIAAPAGLGWLLLGFVLFRLFDILKPWPIAWVDKHVHGGFGIMIDDVLAGIMAAVCLQALAWVTFTFM